MTDVSNRIYAVTTPFFHYHEGEGSRLFSAEIRKAIRNAGVTRMHRNGLLFRSSVNDLICSSGKVESL